MLEPLRLAGLSLLAAGVRVVRIDAPALKDVTQALPGADAVCIGNTPLPAALLDAAPRLRMIPKQGGSNNLPMEALTASRFGWSGQPLRNGIGVPENRAVSAHRS